MEEEKKARCTKLVVPRQQFEGLLIYSSQRCLDKRLVHIEKCHEIERCREREKERSKESERTRERDVNSVTPVLISLLLKSILSEQRNISAR